MGFPVVRTFGVRVHWGNVIIGVGYTNEIDADGVIVVTTTKVSDAFYTTVEKTSDPPPGYEPGTPGVAYSVCSFPSYLFESGTRSGVTFTRDAGLYVFTSGALGQPGTSTWPGVAPESFRAPATTGKAIQYTVYDLNSAEDIKYIVDSDGTMTPLLPITPVEPDLALNALARPVVSLRVTTQTVIDGGGP